MKKIEAVIFDWAGTTVDYGSFAPVVAFAKAFEKFGIKPFSHVGEKFDPNFERVVQEIEDKKTEPGTILSELQKGYTIHDRILREAMVIVSK